MRADLVDAKTQLANGKSKQPTVLGKHFTSLGTKLIDNKQGATPGVHPVILEPKLPTNLSKTLSTSNGAKPDHDSETPQVVEIPQVVGISQEYDQESSINVSDLHPPIASVVISPDSDIPSIEITTSDSNVPSATITLDSNIPSGETTPGTVPSEGIRHELGVSLLSATPEAGPSHDAGPSDEVGIDETKAKLENQLQKSLDALRKTLKERNDEINKLKLESKCAKKVQKDLDEKTVEFEEKVEKISKIMKCNEQLGSTIQTLKDKLSAAESQLKLYEDIMGKQTETIRKQSKTISDLSLRTECNKEVAMIFMDEVLDENTDDSESSEATSKDQIAKLFKELHDEKEKFSQNESEIASLKLLLEEEENKGKKEVGKKEKEVKSLKTELKRLR